MEFSKQENWSGLLCSPGDLPDPGIEPVSLRPILHGQANSLPLAPPGKSHYYCNRCNFSNYCPLTLRLHILLHLTFVACQQFFKAIQKNKLFKYLIVIHLFKWLRWNRYESLNSKISKSKWPFLIFNKHVNNGRLVTMDLGLTNRCGFSQNFKDLKVEIRFFLFYFSYFSSENKCETYKQSRLLKLLKWPSYIKKVIEFKKEKLLNHMRWCWQHHMFHQHTS